MARHDGFETLMVKIESKQKFKQVKDKLEKQLGLSMTNSNAMDMVCDLILSDSIKLTMKLLPLDKGESK